MIKEGAGRAIGLSVPDRKPPIFGFRPRDVMQNVTGLCRVRAAAPVCGVTGLQLRRRDFRQGQGHVSGLLAQILLVDHAIRTDTNVMIPEFLYSAG